MVSPKTTYIKRPYRPESAKHFRVEGTYLEGVPPYISGARFRPSTSLRKRAEALESEIREFEDDEVLGLLVRGDAFASSRIEGISSGTEPSLVAEFSDPRSVLSAIVASNVKAVEAALAGDLSLETLLSVQKKLVGVSHGVRDGIVWIGSDDTTPVSAVYVPPRSEVLGEYLEDLFEFAEGGRVPGIIGAAIFHAQFETIHPFFDGNGRTGRALFHTYLRDVCGFDHVFLPVASGLFVDDVRYRQALDAYREGVCDQIAQCVCDSLERSLAQAKWVKKRAEELLIRWGEDVSAEATDVARVLFQRPALTADAVSLKHAEALRYLLELEKAGIVTRKETFFQNGRRLGKKHYFVSSAILGILEAVSVGRSPLC